MFQSTPNHPFPQRACRGRRSNAVAGRSRCPRPGFSYPYLHSTVFPGLALLLFVSNFARKKSQKENSPVPNRSPSWLSNRLRNSCWRRSAASCHWLCKVFYTIDSQMSTIDANHIGLFGRVVRRLAHSICWQVQNPKCRICTFQARSGQAEIKDLALDNMRFPVETFFHGHSPNFLKDASGRYEDLGTDGPENAPARSVETKATRAITGRSAVAVSQTATA